MDKEIRTLKVLIVKNTIRDIQIRILKEKEKGMIINEDIISEILDRVENECSSPNEEEQEFIDKETSPTDGEIVADAMDDEKNK